jgi:hypothetical protein
MNGPEQTWRRPSAIQAWLASRAPNPVSVSPDLEGQRSAKKAPLHAPSQTGPGAGMAAFDQSRDDRAAERERCRRRCDQSIVLLTAEARSPRPDGGIALPVCEASHAAPFQAMTTCRPSGTPVRG